MRLVTADHNDDDRCEFNDPAIVDLGVSLGAWHARTGGERIALVARWFRESPPRTRTGARPARRHIGAVG